MILALLACDVARPVDEPTESFSAMGVLPSTRWETAYLTLARTLLEGDPDEHTLYITPAEPTIEDSLGEPVLVEPVVWQDYEYGYAAVEGFDPGAYRVTHVSGRELPDAMDFEIEAHGQLPVSFAEGDLFRLTYAWSPLLGGQDYGLVRGYSYLEVVALEGDALDFRLLRGHIDESCVVYEGTGIVDENGRLEFVSEGLFEPIEATDLRLVATLRPDGEELAGVEAQAIVDTRPLEETEGEFCGLAKGFMIECVACTDEAISCLPVGFKQGRMERIDIQVDEDRPDCVDEDGEVQEGALCSLLGGLAPSALLAWTAVLFVRRRRHHGPTS